MEEIIALPSFLDRVSQVTRSRVTLSADQTRWERVFHPRNKKDFKYVGDKAAEEEKSGHESAGYEKFGDAKEPDQSEAEIFEILPTRSQGQNSFAYTGTLYLMTMMRTMTRQTFSRKFTTLMISTSRSFMTIDYGMEVEMGDGH